MSSQEQEAANTQRQISSFAAGNATKSNGKFTPGPWQTNKTASHVFVNNGAGHDGVICKMPFEPSPVQWASGPADLETTNNARLIAAAPELLETLTGIAQDFAPYIEGEADQDIKERNEAWLAQAHAAIAKAQG